MEKIKQIAGEIENIIEAVRAKLTIRTGKFKQNAVGNVESPEFDDSSWEEKTDFAWAPKDGPAYVRYWIQIPDRVEGIKVEGEPVDILFLFPSGVTVFLDGKKIHEEPFWTDMRPHPLRLLEQLKPEEKHLVVLRTPDGDGASCWLWCGLVIGKVEDALFEIQALLYQLRYAQDIIRRQGRRDLIPILKKAVNEVRYEDIKNRRWDALLEQIHRAELALEPFREIARKMTVHLVGHAHIDMNWLWTYQDTQATCVRDFTTVTQLMEEFPDLTFAQSQAHVYSIVERLKPNIFEAVKKFISAGRWEVTANAWTEGDLNMANGESIVRHMLYSRKYAREKLGAISPIMWSPDTFGHPATIPTIITDAGIKNYFFMRCGKGHPLFIWKGPDGSKVTAFTTSYNNLIAPETVIPALLKFREKSPSAHMLFPYGVGDHGGGPTRMDIQRKKMMESKPVMPDLIFSTTEKFFNAVEPIKNLLPVVEGELNPIFQGCYTTHADIKRINRDCENSFLGLESAMASLSVMEDKKTSIPSNGELEDLWRTAMFNQFHDIFDGSAIKSSYEYSREIASVRLQKARDLLNRILAQIGGKPGKKILVFNPLGWSRNGLIQYSLPEDPHNTHTACVSDIPAFGFVSLDTAGLIRTSQNRVEKLGGGFWQTPFYKIHLDEKTGLIRSLYDLKNRRDVLVPCTAVGEDPESWWAENAGNLITVNWEQPHRMSAWIIGNIARTENLISAEKITVTQNELKTVISASRRYRNSSIIQRIVMYPDFPFIDFEADIDWNEDGSSRDGVPMLRVNFMFSQNRPEAWFEIPFGAVKRPCDGREYVALRWAAMRQGNWWAGIINKDKHGYRPNGSALALTLMRNTYEPDSSSDAGKHHVSYRLVFGKLDILSLSQSAAEFNMPLVHCDGVSREIKYSPVEIKGKVFVSCLKPSLDGQSVILRLAEIMGKTEQVRVSFARRIKHITLSNILEEEKNKLAFSDNCVRFEMKPFTIATLKVHF